MASFKNLPVEAYPDVANNYVQVITQWPGRAAEEVEQQVTIPIEVQMNGLPQLVSLRSWSLAGLSSINLTFDDGSNNDLNRQKVLEKLSQVNLPNGLQPTLGADYSPVGQIYFFTLKSTNPNYDVMELKTLQDWVIVKQLKSVPDVVDVSIFGGATREYQVQVDPNKLISYGLSIGQVEQALSNNNVNAGGSFIERGTQAINVRAVGLVQSTEDIEAIAERAERGEDVSAYFTNQHVAKQRVNIDFPLGLLRRIDAECQRVGVTRQTWIKMVCNERLRQTPKSASGGV